MAHRPHLYPPDWKAISAGILLRDGYRCTVCGVDDGVLGYRLLSGEFVATPGREIQELEVEFYDRKIIKIVLSTAHVDNRDPHDCRPENLTSLCQRCHLRHDRDQRRQNASRTVFKKQTQGMNALELETA